MPSTPTLDAGLKYRLLLEMSQKVSGTLDLEEVLRHLLESLRSAVGYDAAGIFVLSRRAPVRRDLWSHLIAGVAQVGFGPPRHDDPMLRSGKGIVGHVIQTGDTVIAPDVRTDPRYVEGRPTTRSEIAVPIISNSQVIGALNLESDRLSAYSSADRELIEFFASAAAISIEKSLLHREVLEKHRIEYQLTTARDVQAGLLPQMPPDVAGYDIAGINLPTYAIGGDYFDYIPLPDGRLGLVIADVSGKGIPAALIMASFRAALRTSVRREPDITAVIETLNQFVLESPDPSRFVTAVYGVLDPGRGSLTYVNCGHNPPLLLRADGRVELLDKGGLALGFYDRRFELDIVTLEPGDTLALYTDGVVEPADANDFDFGVARLERVLRECPACSAENMIRSVVSATRAFTGFERYDDDFTLVVVKRA